VWLYRNGSWEYSKFPFFPETIVTYLVQGILDSHSSSAGDIRKVMATKTKIPHKDKSGGTVQVVRLIQVN
jgi:hypothetical protein